MQSINLLFKTCRRFPIFLGHPDALLSSSRPFHHDHPLINTSTPAPLSTHLLFPRGHPPFPIHHRPCLSLCTQHLPIRRFVGWRTFSRLLASQAAHSPSPSSRWQCVTGRGSKLPVETPCQRHTTLAAARLAYPTYPISNSLTRQDCQSTPLSPSQVRPVPRIVEPTRALLSHVAYTHHL
jgi:hypothetical protein